MRGPRAYREGWLSIPCQPFATINFLNVAVEGQVSGHPRRVRMVRVQMRMVRKEASVHLAQHVGLYEQFCGRGDPTDKEHWHSTMKDGCQYP
ncbi:hypothetical protein TNCV_888981 [Trichonephila clavipes]|nr:hypothetical protein TNCV_888981 [Trichonephila clavipes]